MEPILVILKKRIPLKPALGGLCSLANYSVAYEETQSNRVSDFRDFVYSLFRKAILFDCYSRETRIFGWSQNVHAALIYFRENDLAVCVVTRSGKTRDDFWCGRGLRKPGYVVDTTSACSVNFLETKILWLVLCRLPIGSMPVLMVFNATAAHGSQDMTRC